MTQAEAVRKALETLQARRDARPQEEKDREEAEADALEREGTTPAPDGQVWVCAACGKTSPTKYGFDADEKRVVTNGWDESCMLNSVLCFTEKKNDVWQAVPDTDTKGKGSSG